MNEGLSKAAQGLLQALPDKPISKDSLRTYLRVYKGLDLSDRAIRRAASELRKSGYPICSNSDSKGYWLGNKEDVARTVADLRSRAYDLLRTADKMEGIEIEGQERMVF